MLKIAGRSESRVEELTQPIYSRWRDDTPPIETTILAAPGQIELHLSARGTDDAALVSALDRAEAAIREILPHDVFSSDGRSLEEVIGELLRAAAAADRARRVVYRRARDLAADRRVGLVRLRRALGGGLQQRREDASCSACRRSSSPRTER